MSKDIPVARVNATGALIRLHDGNRTLLNKAGVTESRAKVDGTTGRLVEIDGADYTTMVAASKDLVRIGTAIQSNMRQRETLLTAALKLPGAETYLQTLGVYQGKEDTQYIDPDTLMSNDAGLPESEVRVLSQAEMKALKPATSKSQTRRKKAQAKPDAETPDETPADLSDL